jgi:hypothetical protein
MYLKLFSYIPLYVWGTLYNYGQYGYMADKYF